MSVKGNPVSFLQARVQVREHPLAGDRFHLAFNNLAMTSPGFFQPCALDIGICRPVQLRNERPDKVCFFFETQLTNLRFNLSDRG
jgi:hypothetical protein